MDIGGSILDHFSVIPDPRMDRTRAHNLMDIIAITICAVLCGADGFVAVAHFGKTKQSWFETFLELPNGIPSHDTFGRVFAMIEADEFEKSFVSWVHTIAELTHGDIVAIDGKTNRRSHDKKIGTDAIHLVSAFAARNGITLGQKAIDTKSNEMKAIPKLLNILNVSGCIVTIDAAGCYSDVVDMIVKRQADYVVAVKQNQPTLYTHIETLFVQHNHKNLPSACTEEKSHGRYEKRECWIINTPEELQSMQNKKKWSNLACVAKIINTRTVDRKTTTEHRYYISSLHSGNAEELLTAARQHWRIENTLHWTLDVTFREDDSRIRSENAQQNFSIIRKMALNLLKQEKTLKGSINIKRLTAGWDEHYLLKLLDI